MDISAFDYQAQAERGYTFTLILPDKTESDIKISVVGADSKAYRAAYTAAIRKAAKEESAASIDEANAEVYAECVTKIEGLEIEGKPFVFTLENVRELLARYVWICDQVAAVVDKRANFTKPLKTS